MMKSPPRARPVVGFTDNRQAVADQDLITASVLSVDEAARGAERRWGVGRLVRLVSPATLVRFRAANDMWTKAYSHDRDITATVKTSAMMIRAWQALEWAIRRGWGGRPVAPPQAQGMLVATLCVLAAHFGLVATPRAA